MASGESGAGKVLGGLLALIVCVGLIGLKMYGKIGAADRNAKAEAVMFDDYKEKARSLLALSKECRRDQKYTDWALDQFHPAAWDAVIIKIGRAKAHVEGGSYRTELLRLMAEQALKDNRPELSQALESLDKAAAGISNEWYELRGGAKSVK